MTNSNDAIERARIRLAVPSVMSDGWKYSNIIVALSELIAQFAKELEAEEE